MDRTQLLIEANRRGILSGNEKIMFDEAVSRGLIKIPDLNPSARPNAQPRDTMAEDAQRTLSVTPAELIAGSAPVRFAMGAASPVIGLAQLAANAIGGTTAEKTNAFIRQLDEIKRRGMEAYGQEGMDIAGIAGSALIPGGLAARTLTPAATVAGRIAQGAGVGATSGAVTPITNDYTTEEKITQVGLGGLVGGIIPGAIEGGKAAFRVGRNLVDSIIPGNAERIVARTVKEAVGPRYKSVLDALEQNRQLPGARISAGEVAAPAGSAELAAIQRIAARQDPSGYQDMAKASNEARLAAIRSFGGDIGKATADRTAVTDPLKRQAMEAAGIVGVSPSRMFNRMRGLGSQKEIRTIDVVQKSLAEVRDKIQAFTNKDGFIDPRDLYGIRKQLGNIIKKHAGETQNWDARLNSGLQRKVQSYMDDAISAAGGKTWKDYLRTYADKSKRIDQIKISEFLEGKLSPALSDFGATGNQRMEVFAGAVREAPSTIKRSLGTSRYDDLADVLTPRQVETVRNVAKDLARRGEYETLAKIGTERAKQIIGDLEPNRLPNALHRPIMVINAILNRIGGRVQGRSLQLLAEKMKDPKEMARIMKLASPPERDMLIDALIQRDVIGAAASIPQTMRE